jgi:F-type H+-transporting ATPase subunit b
MSIDQTIIAQVLTTAIAFLVFFWISKKLFWTGIVRTIDERQARIRGDFDRIDQMQKKVDDLQADYSKRIEQIEAEARARMQEAIDQGHQIAEQIREQARKDASAELEHTKEMIVIEMDKARVQLKQEVVRMTLTVAEKIIRERLDDAKHRELVSGFIDGLGRQ